MKYIVSRYNQDISWINDYTNDIVLYDRSDEPLSTAIVVPNIGTDLHDKLSYIIDNYNNLPDVAIYTKANIFKYISKEEFDTVKDNTKYTPLLTQHHHTYLPICYYEHNLYHELNNFWYLGAHPCQSQESMTDLLQLLNNVTLYHAFAPGSNYILTRQDILQHTKVFYMKLRSFLEWDRYPGEAMIIERHLHHIWK